ncbi:MAG: DUF86 domain-containing protein [Deltaproteobacteria bacterium]
MSKDDLIRLKHILEATMEALDFVKGKSRTDFDKNRMLVLSLIKEIEIMGEAASKISNGVKEKYPHIPWGDITGMRNYLIHAYFDIDFDMVWKTVTEDLPPLAAEIEKVLSREDKR